MIDVIINKLKEKGLNYGVASLTLLANDMLFDNVAFIHKYLGYLRQAKDAVIPSIYGIVGTIMNLPGGDEAFTLGVASGLKGVLDAFVFKKPFAYAKDASTLEVFNLDPNDNITVIVDGSTVSFTTAPTTDGNGNATITLPSPLAAGKHEIIVKTSKRAYYGAVAV